MLSLTRSHRYTWHFHTYAARQLFYRINKTHACMFHHKADRRAMGSATKTVIKLLGLANRKRGRFFAVKRTAGGVICASLFKGDVTLNHIDDIETIEQILNKTFWNHSVLATVRQHSRITWYGDAS